MGTTCSGEAFGAQASRRSAAQRGERAEEVPAERLPDPLLGPAPLEHPLHETRQLEARPHVGRRDDEPVPVAAEGGRVLARDAGDVLQMVDDARGRAASRAEEAAVLDDADDAARVGDGAQLLVVDVAPVAVDAGDAGVADEERARAIVRVDGVEEAAPVDVREVDEDAMTIELVGKIPGRIAAQNIVVERKSDIQCFRRVTVTNIDIRGRMSGEIVAAGSVTTRP